MDLSNVVDSLITVFTKAPTPPLEGVEYHVSRTISALAVGYEKVRNAVEFRADHLIRRASVERILKRQILLGGSSETIAHNLVTELLWARYIDSSLVDQNKIKQIRLIVERYITVKQQLPTLSQKAYNVSWDALLGLASSEIEELLVDATKREALTDFVYQALRTKILIKDVDESSVNLSTYIAVERSFAQSDDELISFHLLKVTFPEWLSHDPKDTPKLLPQFWHTIERIRSALRSQQTESIFRFIRKQIPPFLLVRDFFLEVNGKARQIIDDELKFEEKLTEIAERRYKEIGAKVRRAMVRSFIYIFLTKMVFAFALEAPYDIYIAKKLTYLPLVVNMIFPPIMLFLVAGLFNVPGADNTKRLIARVKKIIYHFDDLQREDIRYHVKAQVRRPILFAAFTVIYIATFILTFGLINYLLSLLQFSIASKVIFVFFMALVSFFAYRIRISAKEYEIVDRQGFLEPLFDIFLLPVLRAGQFLSREIAKINIFIFIFDFILEAPLKVVFEVVEEWIHFIRNKKEEIL